jgi:anhydro-N-acetylmuramic acid kinase
VPRLPVHALDRARARLLGEGAVVAGVLSGTSADGIDVALARLVMDGAELAAPELVCFETLPFAAPLHARLRSVLDGAPCALAESARLSRDLGCAFGSAARALAQREGLALDLVGSHGQTVWHHDGALAGDKATLQLGEGDHVAQAAGAPVACDFRQADLAAGGEGAPLSALADGTIFRALPRPTVILNLGGMANLTVLGADGSVRGWDTGPANSLLDGLARRFLGQPFDRDGAAAARGRVQAALVERWLEHPYFGLPLPKSTGRDTFGEAWVERCLEEARSLGCVEPADLCASAVEFLARTIAQDLARLPEHSAVGELLVAGGGVHHRPWMQALARLTGRKVCSSRERGIDPDAREGLVFAVLAARCVLGIPSTRREATGAAPGRVLGKLCWSS